MKIEFNARKARDIRGKMSSELKEKKDVDDADRCSGPGMLQ